MQLSLSLQNENAVIYVFYIEKEYNSKTDICIPMRVEVTIYEA